MVNVSSHAGHFFQSDAELKKLEEREKRVNFSAGDAVRVPSKILAMVVNETDIYVAESGGVTQRIPIDPDTKALARVEPANPKTGAKAKAKVEFIGHQGPVTALALSHRDTELILWTGSWDKTIKKWDAETGECKATLLGHTDFVKALAVVGNTLYSSSADRHIRRWEETVDAATGKATMTCTKKFQQQSRSIESLAVSEDGQYLFSASSDRTVCRWNLVTDTCDKVYEGHDTNVFNVMVSEDDLWTASADKTVRRWGVDTGVVDTCLTHPDNVKCVNRVGSFVVTGASDGYVRVWDIVSGDLTCTIVGHFDEVSCLAVLGSTVYSGSHDNTLRRWPISKAFLLEQNEIAKEQKQQEQKEKEKGSELTEDEERELAELMDDE